MRLALDGVRGVVDVVESMHGTIQRFTLPIGPPPAKRTRGITGLVYRGIRGGIDLVGGRLEASLAPWADLVTSDGSPSARRDALLAAVNGVWGDYLWASGNALAIPMSLRPADSESSSEVGDPSDVGDRLLVLAHGLCMSDGGWRTKDGHDHGAQLADALNLVPLYLQYNSGLPIHRNGREFAALLEIILRRWPRPVDQIILLGYSMGGLVARSACYYAETEGYEWTSKLHTMVFLGTPHHGSPLSRGGAWVDAVLDVSPYSAPLTRLTRRRSAGIADLRYGTLTEDAQAVVPLPAGVRCFALAGSQTTEPSATSQPSGDGLVPIDSALGRHRDANRTLEFPDAHRAVIYGVSHLGLLANQPAFRQMRDWIRS